MSDGAKLLALEHISKRYDEAGDGAPVLRDVCLEVEGGQSVAVVGPSGCGKSTLLNIIGALDRASGGSVRLEGRDLSALEEKELARLRNRKIGFVFQAHHLLPQCTVLENVLVPTLAKGRSSEEDGERARRLLGRVGLTEKLDRWPGELSGGQRQRVAVVRALINEPRLLLADEPTGSLDRTSAEGLMDLLIELNREEGVSLIVVTHALELAGRMQRVLELREGVLEASEG